MALFSKNPLKKMKLEDLQKERIGIERKEKVLSGEIRDISDKRRKLFSKGFDKKLTNAEKHTIVVNIKSIDRNLQQKEVQHKKVCDTLSAVNGLIFIKENEKQLKNTPFMNKMLRISGSTLQDVLNNASVKEAIKSGKIDQLNKVFDMEYKLGMEAIEDDESVKQLMDIWSAGEVADIDESYESWSKNKEEELEETA